MQIRFMTDIQPYFEERRKPDETLADVARRLAGERRAAMAGGVDYLIHSMAAEVLEDAAARFESGA